MNDIDRARDTLVNIMADVLSSNTNKVSDSKILDDIKMKVVKKIESKTEDK